jgi:UDP-perosamine 4-acetyltransferase
VIASGSPTTDIVLVGGGGHASVCLDVLRAQGRTVVGYTGPAATVIDLEYLGPDDDYFTDQRNRVEIFVAVGDNQSRLQLLRRLTSRGFQTTVAIHPSSVVAPSSSICPGSVLMAGTVVNARTVIGSGAIINTGTTVDHDCHIGDAVHLAPGTHLAGSVTIGEGTFLGVGVGVIPHCTVGEWAVVGAGAAVVTDLPGGRTYVGVPARPLVRRS